MTKYARRLRASATSAEDVLWQALRRGRYSGLRFRRQHPIGSYIVDFYCPAAGLVIEVDGGVHSDPVQRVEDHKRDAALRRHGCRVMRIKNRDVLHDLERVLALIHTAAAAAHPVSHRGKGKGIGGDGPVHHDGSIA